MANLSGAGGHPGSGCRRILYNLDLGQLHNLGYLHKSNRTIMNVDKVYPSKCNIFATSLSYYLYLTCYRRGGAVTAVPGSVYVASDVHP